MTRSEDVVAAIGRERDGIVRTDDLVAHGLDDQVVDRLRRRGLLVAVGPRVSRLRDHPWTWRAQARAALDLAGPAAALGRRTAARLYVVYRYQNAPELEVVVARHHHRVTNHATLIETRLLPPEHVTEVDGLRCTTLARTFFDLCADPDGGRSVKHPAHEQQMARVYNDAVARRGLSFAHEVAVLTVLAKRGRTGTRLVRRLLQRFGPDHEPTWSETESLFMELVDAYGLPIPKQQVPISDEYGWIGTVDFFWPDARLVVEIDSTWHDGPLDREADRERDRRLEAAGYVVKRFRYRHLALDSHRVAALLASILLG